MALAAPDNSHPPKDVCPGIAPEVLAQIIEVAETEFAGGSKYGYVVRMIGKWAKAQEPPLQFTSDQRRCWLKHVKAIRDKTQAKKRQAAWEEDSVDFRKTRWGMTPEQVQATEKTKPYRELADGSLLYLVDIDWAPAAVAYSFTNGVLTLAAVEFPEAQENRLAVQLAVKLINKKATKEAGEPIKKAVEGDVIYWVWQSKRTRTMLMISVTLTSMDVTVIYGSVKHKKANNTLPDLD